MKPLDGCKLVSGIWLLLVCIAMPQSHGQLSNWRNDLDEYISAVLQCRNIPGLSIAVVQNGQTVLSDGYGFSKTDTLTPADGDTLYPIGSLTKSFTSAVIADILSRHTNFTWDTPIAEALGPSFRLSGCYRTEEVNLRDLLSHRVGLEEDVILTVMGLNIEDSEFVRRLGYLKERYPFRSRFFYSNYMYSLAGKVAEVLTDKTYAELVKETLFDPLGMTSSDVISNVDNLSTLPKLAHGYAKGDNGQSLSFSLDTIRVSSGVLKPSGSILSTVDDLAKWMIFQLSGGRSVTDRQVVNSEFLRETQRAQMALHDSRIRDRSVYPVDDTMVDYGMGWVEGQYRGFTKLTHSGSIASYTSMITMLPTENIGIVAVLNGPMNEGQAITALKTVHFFVADKLLNVTPWLDKDSACTFPAPWVNTSTSDNQLFPPSQDPTVSEDFTDLELYTGTYGHLAYGNLHISKAENIETGKSHLRYRYGMFGSGRLYPMEGHTFKITLDGDLWYYADSLNFNAKSPGGVFIEFREPSDGKMTKVIFPNAASIRSPEFVRDITISDDNLNNNEQCDNTSSGAKVRSHQLLIALITLICVFRNTRDFNDFV